MRITGSLVRKKISSKYRARRKRWNRKFKLAVGVPVGRAR